MPDELIIDPKATALVVIDLQKGIASMKTVPHDSATVVSNAARLVAGFRGNGMPVFLVRVSPTPADRLNPATDDQWKPPAQMPADWAELVITPAEGDVVITKKQ